MSLEVQLEGSIKFGYDPDDGTPDRATLVEYGCEISSLVLNRTRQQIARPPSFCNAQTIQKAGAKEDSLTINFFG